jgi:hypothetical protein
VTSFGLATLFVEGEEEEIQGMHDVEIKRAKRAITKARTNRELLVEIGLTDEELGIKEKEIK